MISISLAVLSGALVFFSFPKWNAGWLAWFALVPALASSTGPFSSKGLRRAFALGGFSGLVAYCGMLYWIVPTFRAAGVSSAVGILSTVLLAAYLALYFGIFSAALYRAWGALSPSAWIFFGAALWTALEWVRGLAFSGFPWGALGYSQWQSPIAIQISEWTGVHGVTFSVALANLFFFRWMRDRRPNPAALAAILGFCAANAFLYDRETRAPDASRIEVAILQGNIDQYQKWSPEYVEGILKTYRALSEKAAVAEPKPDLVVWPETALPGWIPQEEALFLWTQRVVKESGARHLIGAVTRNGGNNFNSAFLFSPDGNEIGRYDKIRLVPFGEFVPLQPLLGKFVSVLNELGGFDSGPEGKVLEAGGVKVGASVCYEAIFPELIRQQAAAGAQMLANVTNDGWYLDTAAPEQHFSMNVLRAVENRRALVRAANTGISGIILPSGRIGSATQLGERTSLAGSVPLREGLTLYSRFGDLFAWACAALSIFGLVATLRSKRSRT